MTTGCGPVTSVRRGDAGWAGVPVVGGDVVYTSTGSRVEGFDASGCGVATCPSLVAVPVDEGGELSVGDGHVLVAGRSTLTALAVS
jgi:hypothetical protein